MYLSNIPYQYNQILKPIFHCDAKPFALGSGVASGPPSAQFRITYTNRLVSKNAKICVSPYAKP